MNYFLVTFFYREDHEYPTPSIIFELLACFLKPLFPFVDFGRLLVCYRLYLESDVFATNFYIEVHIVEPIPLVRSRLDRDAELPLELTADSLYLGLITIEGSFYYRVLNIFDAVLLRDFINFSADHLCYLRVESLPE